MNSRRYFIKKGTLTISGLAVVGTSGVFASVGKANYVTNRPAIGNRHFTSIAVEKVIAASKTNLKDEKLAWMFENCFPNTLDTTVEYGSKNGKPDTFVITGDIHAMWSVSYTHLRAH